MGYLEEMIAEEDGVEIIFKQYVEVHNNVDYIFFFEGKDDFNYYEPRITAHIGTKGYETFNCDGKKNVLEVQRMIKTKTRKGQDEHRLYFVDRDFDITFSYDDEVYVTPTYAIENFYVSDSAIRNTIKGLWGLSGVMSPDDKTDYETAINILKSERDAFINKTIIGNAWYSLQKRKGEQIGTFVNLSPIKDYTGIIDVKSIDELEKKVPNSIPISEKEIKEEINRLNRNPVESLRGKYFEQFMPRIYGKIIQDGNQKDSNRKHFKKKHKVRGQISSNDMIRLFSCYADMPDCLVQYLSKNL